MFKYTQCLREPFTCSCGNKVHIGERYGNRIIYDGPRIVTSEKRCLTCVGDAIVEGIPNDVKLRRFSPTRWIEVGRKGSILFCVSAGWLEVSLIAGKVHARLTPDGVKRVDILNQDNV